MLRYLAPAVASLVMTMLGFASPEPSGATATAAPPRRRRQQQQQQGVVKRQNIKGCPKGSTLGQGPDKPGQSDSFKKAKLRKAKEDARAARREKRAEEARGDPEGCLPSSLAALQVDTAWAAIRRHMFGEGEESDLVTLEEQRHLKRFFVSAIQARVTASHIEGLENAYAIDKFASRADEAACLLLSTTPHGALPQLPPAGVLPEAPVIRVASIGGGPGNDALGFSVFANIFGEQHGWCQAVEVDSTVYDFAPGWGNVVEKLDAALQDASVASLIPLARTRFSFELCDLQHNAGEPTNAALMGAVPTFHYFMFCYCLHESRALSMSDLFAEVCRTAQPGAVIVVLEVFKQVALDAAEVAAEYGFAYHDVPSGTNAPFNGGYFVKGGL
eukprot:TRINITY_DN13066_c0_g1_i1.p1 TRINITY_DN13066_c0_g1~~TRINITY_DN13066_c0_g1_i1.p1  ORF type:complete len:405 (+),score=141.15 TRINITY_DN13066_c0_g1_i1:55-1215(+)